MEFQFLSKRWEIEIIFLIKESSKTLAYFLYNIHTLFHLKVPEISFSNLRLFSHVDDPLLQETQSELVKHQLDVGVGKYVELHQPVKNHRYPSCGGGACWHRGPGSCLTPLTEYCGRVWWCTPSCPGFPTTSHTASIFFFLEAPQPYLLLSLHSFSLTLTILIFFIQTQNFKNKRISIEVFEILRT